MEMSYHCRVERAERVKQIIANVGIGQIVKECYIRNLDKIVRGELGCYLCITDTGITIIKTEDKLKVITMYITTYRELVMAYKGAKNIPNYLRKKVDHNQSKFIKEGKTIWR